MKHDIISRRTFLGMSATGLMAASLATGENVERTAPVWETRLRVSNGSGIRVLQFTDIHLFNGVNRWPKREERQRQQTLEDMRHLIDQEKPDLLLITGDLWHDNPDGRGAEFMGYAVEQCAGLGVPWAFTWGNHDQIDDYALGHTALTEAKNALYGGSASGGNYVLVLEGSDGARLAEIYCLNTRNTGVHEEARQFLREAAATLDASDHRPMRLAAFHIPIKQYKDVWDSGVARGIIGEDVCLEQEDGSSLSVFNEVGIQAVVCGHDHVNDYSGFMEDVDLIYGRATGYNGYGADTVAKGGKVYILDPARKACEWESLQFDGTRWRPTEGQRTDTRKQS